LSLKFHFEDQILLNDGHPLSALRKAKPATIRIMKYRQKELDGKKRGKREKI